MLPMILRIRIKNADTNFGLFLPMILIYILLLPVFAAVLIVLVLMLAAPGMSEKAWNFLKILFHLPALLSAARGMEVKVHSNDADVIMFVK